MALPAINGNTIVAADLYQLCRPSGGAEGGKYFVSGWSNASGDLLQAYIPSQSRNATPVSVSIDTVDQSATNVNAPSTGHLTASGFQVYTTSTSAQASNLQVGGGYTISY